MKIHYTAVAPVLFVFLWSTGFIGTKLGIPYAEPLTFLTVRLSIASVLLFVLVPLLKEPWIGGGIFYYTAATWAGYSSPLTEGWMQDLVPWWSGYSPCVPCYLLLFC